jgi:hypothetical protein
MVIIELSCTQSSEQQITMNYDKKMQQKEYSTAKAKRFFLCIQRGKILPHLLWHGLQQRINQEASTRVPRNILKNIGDSQ